MIQQQSPSHVGRMRQMNSTFAKTLEIFDSSNEQSSHHMRRPRFLKNDHESAIWGVKHTAECEIKLLSVSGKF